jgi:hypothetical protein
MAQITINIPDEYVQRVIDGICNALDYKTYIIEHPSTTKSEFARLMVIKWIKRMVFQAEYEVAKQSAEIDLNNQITSINIT